MRQLNKLSPAFVKSAPAGKHPDGGGLYFVKGVGGSAQWIYRYSIGGKRHEMGLGGYPSISVASARRERSKWADVRAAGKDPIRVRDAQQREALRGRHTLSEVTAQTFEARKAGLRDGGKAGRWLSPLEVHVLPVLGSMPIDEISQQDIVRALRPIWNTKPVTADKAINRLGLVLKYGAALGLPVDLNAKEAAKALMGEQNHKAENIPALDWRELPEFYSSLNEGTPTHLALRLLILTGLRSKPVRFCHIDQINGDTWTVPEGLIKGREGKTQAFRVPLSGEALRVIAVAKEQMRNGLLFPGKRKSVISDMSMSTLMKRRNMKARPHGFRSSLRTWMAEATETPFDVSETMLGHAVGSKVVRSYNRTDYLEQRRALLERWANHCTGKAIETDRVAVFGKM
ncbi:site-specific integrase [Pseudohalocynthiibacter sp. F2068]|uniref:tyrosine-type recombinase/integrase n=1 Tax=Pseudohalocynthiibacter sp. F2068 TaxID=2926418 RepID=UPI001FF62A03|nr:site-specific integrase [Pseudohalocynthiibacter sp. F2068]MCK0101191.1 integrase arm-type DNA-binding domain-containing protein [Pseudohalocynthiibacter sp. F2068]